MIIKLLLKKKHSNLNGKRTFEIWVFEIWTFKGKIYQQIFYNSQKNKK